MLKIAKCRMGKSDVSVKFSLVPLVTDWEKAKSSFTSFVVSAFGPDIRPHDFVSSFSLDMGENWCKYRIHGGPNMATLRSDSLEFSFRNTSKEEHSMIFSAIMDVTEGLLKNLGRYNNCPYWLSSSCHVDLIEGTSKAYLSQFAMDSMKQAGDVESGMHYRPSVRFVLRSDDGSWTLIHTVEQSEILSNGLFVTMSMFSSITELTNLDGEFRKIMKADGIADRAVGISYQ